MIKYAIFIEPEGALAEFIARWKARVDSVLPGQVYCSHPAHCTLIVGALSGYMACLTAVARAVRMLQPFTLRAEDTVVFYDDIPAGGGHTAAVRVTDNADLLGLQKTISEEWTNHVDPEKAEALAGRFKNEAMRESCLRYGFPFVGEHWIPHFSIASLKVAKDHSLLREFQKERFKFEFTVNGISMWQIDGDEHQKVASLPLG